jgi:hypothetical protein
MHSRLFARFCVVTGAVLVGGCASKTADRPTPTSCNVDTKGLKVSLSAQADGPTTQFFAALFEDADGSLALDCGDSFSVTTGAQKITLQRESAPGAVIHYTASIPSAPDAATFAFSFDRQPPHVSAPSSMAFVPAAFTVVEPSTQVNLAKGDPMAFRLEPPMVVDATAVTPTTVRLRIGVQGSCLEEQEYTWTPRVLFPPEVDADGQVKLDTKLFKRQGTEPACDATVTVAELTGGSIDAAFAGGVSGGNDSEGSRHVPPFTVHVAW